MDAQTTQGPYHQIKRAGRTISTKWKQRAKQRIEDQQMQLQVKMSRLGGKVIELKKLNKSYGDKVILKGFDYTFKKENAQAW